MQEAEACAVRKGPPRADPPAPPHSATHRHHIVQRSFARAARSVHAKKTVGSLNGSARPGGHRHTSSRRHVSHSDARVLCACPDLRERPVTFVVLRRLLSWLACGRPEVQSAGISLEQWRRGVGFRRPDVSSFDARFGEGVGVSGPEPIRQMSSGHREPASWPSARKPYGPLRAFGAHLPAWVVLRARQVATLLIDMRPWS